MVKALPRIKKVFLNGALYGTGVLAVLGIFLLVRAQIQPGTVQSPNFGPPTDVDVDTGRIPCDWSGLQYKRFGPDYNPSGCGSDDERIAAAILVECTNGFVSGFSTGFAWYNVGPTCVSCNPATYACTMWN